MSERGATSPALVKPPTWHLARYGWRFARHMTPRRADRLLRWRVLGRLSLGWRARFEAMGLPEPLVTATLAQVRSVAGWAEAWTGAAQHLLGEARRAAHEHDDGDGALATRQAALCYHIASWFAFDDPRVGRACRASAVSLFGRAIAATVPDTRRVLIPWRARTLPAYLTIPSGSSWAGARPLVVFLNGVTTSKEELILWRHAYVERGMAVLALDWPGTGEAMEDGPSPDHDDFTDGLLDLAKHDRDLDPDRIALVGFNLGGAMAVRTAALDRRIAAVVAVTPPFDVRPWMRAASPLLREQFAAWSADEAWTAAQVEGFALEAVLPQLKAPLLVFGAGRDLLVPPSESVRLAAAYGERATLVWFENGGHGLYDVLDQWTGDSARWLEAVFAIEPAAADDRPSTWVDASEDRVQHANPAWSQPEPLAETHGASEPLARSDSLP